MVRVYSVAKISPTNDLLDGYWYQEEYDTHDPKGHCALVLPFLKKRSKIIEIVAARDIVFALAQSGVCAAFSRGSLTILVYSLVEI